jgi:hypothetical protein
MLRGALALVAVASVIVAVAACGEDFKDCYGEDLVSCTCAGGALGYAKCGPAGDYKSSACVCDGTTPGVDAGACTRDGGATDSGAFKKDFESCATANECDGCRCELFQSKQLCTHACLSDADCPLTGCTPRGVCRNP